ncbi:alpha/beta hydrolase [Lentzea nigeriaca]|uniref:alpha/beta hydrolase n=1 Tax=Lentzea nigeriaca TaxID=1128665 RepID=UPI00195DEF19|nr:alpha/beta hydrolase [Lentzea nigeriaca]MBM7863114.1 pimeloyl-ACP methyl ester carboxylesterase [Lentzea nigeriaca]
MTGPAAQDPAQASEPSVVFVHGAYHEGSCWSLVRDRLAQAGIASQAVDLPFDSFTNDCTAVRSAVAAAKANGPVLLVGHSYSGLIISAAGHEADGLLYVTARMPAADEIPADAWTRPRFRAAITAAPNGDTMLTPSAADLLYNTTHPDLRRSAQQAWRPMRSEVPRHPIPDPAWTRIWTCYVACTQDRVVSVSAQRAVAVRADNTIELNCDHSPFFSAPGELAAVVERAVFAIRTNPFRRHSGTQTRSR